MPDFDAVQPLYKPIYRQLRDAIDVSKSGIPVEIEILLESHVLGIGIYIVVEDGYIGIPVKSLRVAYIIARELFFEELERPNPDSGVILATSAVLLLFQPEHLTAANSRKRTLLELRNDDQEQFNIFVKEEFWLLNSIFGSKLNRHTKSPTLWGHRRWLVKMIGEQDPDFKHKEVHLILSAAEIHPKNFYAWDYMRWWVNRYPELLEDFNPKASSYSITTDYPKTQLTSFILKWTLQNPSDTSGWSFLLFILISHKQTSNQSPDIAKRVLEAAMKLKLRNESLWFFLRSLMASEYLTPALRQAYIKDLKSIAHAESKRPEGPTMAKAILKTLSDTDWAA